MSNNELIYLIKKHKTEAIDAPVWLSDSSDVNYAISYLFNSSASDIFMFVDSSDPDSDLMRYLNTDEMLTTILSYLNDTTCLIQILTNDQKKVRKTKFYKFVENNHLARRVKVRSLSDGMFRDLEEKQATNEFVYTDCDMALIFFGKFSSKGRVDSKRSFMNFHDTSFFNALKRFFMSRISALGG